MPRDGMPVYCSAPCLWSRGVSVVWPKAYCFCPVRLCVHPCVHSETLTQYLAECLTHFHQTYINDALRDRDECVTIWGQRSRSRWFKVCWKQHCLGLLTRCLEKYYLDFHQTYTNDVLRDRNECIKFCGQKVRVQGHSGRNIYWNRHRTGGNMQYSTSRIKLYFLFYLYVTSKSEVRHFVDHLFSERG